MEKVKQFQSRENFNHESAEHDKVLVDMFAEVGGEIVKIISVDDGKKEATVQFGKNGDTEGVSFNKLRTLKTTERVASKWGGIDEQNLSEEKLAA